MVRTRVVIKQMVSMQSGKKGIKNVTCIQKILVLESIVKRYKLAQVRQV